MRQFRFTSGAVFVFGVGVLASTGHPQGASAQSGASPEIAMALLDGSLEPLIDRFNAESEKPRIVMLLAPS